MRILFPESLDTFNLPVDRERKNIGTKLPVIEKGDEWYILQELEKIVGSFGSVDSTSHEYRIALLEAAIATLAAIASSSTSVVSNIASDARSGTKVISAAGIDTVIFAEAMPDANYTVFAYVQTDIGAVLAIPDVSSFGVSGFDVDVPDAGDLYYVAVSKNAGSGVGVAEHNLLSASHGDTLAASVVRGDLIIGNATPKWSRLAIGTSGQLLQTDGTDVAWATINTDLVPEGATNLYFTNERVDDRVAALLVAGTGIVLTYNDGAGTLTIDGSATGAPDDAQYLVLVANGSLSNERVLTPGASLVAVDNGAGAAYELNTIQDIRTTAIPVFAGLTLTGFSGVLKATAGVVSGGATTTDLAEGTNLYFTDERVDDRVAALLIAGTNITLTYNDPANTLTIDASITGAAPVGEAYVTIGNTGGLSAERALTGTANQITVTDNGANSTVVLSTPQDIHTAASPTFTGLTLSGLTHALVNFDGSGVASEISHSVIGGVLYSQGTTAAPIWTINPLIAGYVRIGSSSAPSNTTAGDLTVIRLKVGNAAFGDNASVQTDITNTGTSGNEFGHYLIPNYNPSGATTAAFYGVFLDARLAGVENLAGMTGLASVVRFSASGNATTLSGIAPVGFYGSTSVNFGTITNVIGASVQSINHFTNNPTGTISNAEGIRVQNASRGGAGITITRLSGITIAAQTLGTNNTNLLIGTTSIPTGTYSIYNSSASANYFTGNLIIGVDGAGRELTIRKTSANAGIQLVSSGGSGKTWAIISGTGGTFDIQDDSDSAPLFRIAGSDDSFLFSGFSKSTWTQTAASSGTRNLWVVTGAAHTAQTASTELIDLNFNLARTVQFATGAIATQRAVVFQAPTYAAVGASVITNAATLAITGAPIAGANVTITRAMALWVQDGAIYAPNSRIDADAVIASDALSGFNISLSGGEFSISSGVGTHGLLYTGGSIVAKIDHVAVGSALVSAGTTTVPAWSNKLLLGAGTAADATYSFDGDPNLGMYRFAADQLGFTANGLSMRLINNQVQLADGTAGAPGYSFLSQTNIGMRRITTSQLALVTAGADRISIDASGNVGIGTITFGTSAAGVLALFNGTVPSTSPADTVQLFSVDLSAGNATLGIRTETALVTETVVSDRTLSIKHNGVTVKLCIKA